MEWRRILRHLAVPHWTVRRAFTSAVLSAIETAIRRSEATHRGEIRFAVEGELAWSDLRNGVSARQRAARAFSDLRVWDTAENTGVLIYVQWVDRRVEILADRGIAAVVAQSEWDAVCRGLEAAFRAGRYQEGSCAAVAAVGRLLTDRFPAGTDNPDELPDRPVLL